MSDLFDNSTAERRSAVISDCKRYRYRLRRHWGWGRPLLFVMLNPSTADADLDDPTIRRCIGFAKAHGFDGMEVVNLFAFRATDPKDLARAGYPVGPENDFHIEDAAKLAGDVCVAWGAVAAAEARTQEVMPILWRAGLHPKCLHITRSGYPGHPLYLAGDKRLRPFDLAAIDDAMHPPTATQPPTNQGSETLC